MEFRNVWKQLKPNVGLADRIFRTLLGGLLVMVFLFVDLPFLTSMLVLGAGLVSILSGILGFCFFYYYLKGQPVENNDCKK